MSHISVAHMVTDRKVRDEQTVDDTMTQQLWKEQDYMTALYKPAALWVCSLSCECLKTAQCHVQQRVC